MAKTVEADSAPYRIGVLDWSMNIPSQVAMRHGFEAEAQRINRAVELLPDVAGDGAGGVERQITQMHAMVRKKPDVIIVQPTDNAALAEPLKAANRAGIPVVAYDQYLSGGKLAGGAILRDFPKAGSIDALFTVNDGGGLAVVDALARAGRNEIGVASIDGDPDSVANIRAGRLTRIDSAQFCGPLGAEAMRAAHAVPANKASPAIS